MATFVDYQPKLRNLAVNGFAVLANECAEKDANVGRGRVGVLGGIKLIFCN